MLSPICCFVVLVGLDLGPLPVPTVLTAQAVIDANIIPPLLRILTDGEFKTRKEAAWAVSNGTSGGTDAQIK